MRAKNSLRAVASMPGVGIKQPMRYIAIRAQVIIRRLFKSGILNELVKALSIDYFCFSAGIFDFFTGRLGKGMGLDSHCRLKFSFAQYFYQFILILNETLLF